jgi:hypothetical protein
MEVLLFLMTLSDGWIKFSAHNTFSECNEVKELIVYDERIEGLCCMPTLSECVEAKENKTMDSVALDELG